MLVTYLNKETLLFLFVKHNHDKNLDFYFIATNVLDIFYSYLNITYFLSFQVVFYFTLYQIVNFFLPALYRNEKLKLKLIVKLSVIFWLFGVTVFNLIVFPLCWGFFISFQFSSNNVIEIFFEYKITEYLKFYFLVYYVTIVFLQFFVFLFYLLFYIDKKFNFIKKTRKIIYILFFVTATIVTPPDVISQIIFGVLFLILYELIIIINIVKVILVR